MRAPGSARETTFGDSCGSLYLDVFGDLGVLVRGSEGGPAALLVLCFGKPEAQFKCAIRLSRQHDLAQLLLMEALLVRLGERQQKAHAPIEGVHRQRSRLHAQRVPVEVNRAGVEEAHRGKRLAVETVKVKWAGGVLEYEPSRPRHRVNGVAHHLRADLRKLLAQRLVRQMMQCHPVPAPGLLDQWHERVAD